MSKKKEPKHIFRFFRAIARGWIISMPAAIILAALLLFGKISFLSAGLLLLIVVVVATLITSSVFHELENFITYLKNLAQGLDIEPPHFQKGIFSSSRLADTFQSVKNRWLSQTLSEARILETLPDPLLMIDQAGTLVFMNHQARISFGKTHLGKPITHLFRGSKFRRSLQSVLSEKSATEWFEWDFTRAHQTYSFQVRLDHLPAPTRNGAIAVLTLHDITPFKRFREQQIEFFANASHELKTPLSIISGFVETLQGPARNDESARDQFLDMMGEQVARMSQLVQKLLQLSRRQMMDESVMQDTFDLGALVQSVLHDFQNKALQNHKRIIFRATPPVPPFIGNREEMAHMLQNLIDNAIKYSSPKSTITVRLYPTTFPTPRDTHKPAIALSVQNQGHPIAPRHLDKLFNRFYRVNSIENRHIEGTGLGLGIVQQIVHNHGGIIDVTSTRRDGTTFCIYLPRT